MRHRLPPLSRCILIPLLLLALTARGPALAQEAKPTTAPSSAPATAPGVENSVVKIFATTRYPDPFKPWSKQSPREGSGTGVVIEGNRILTNAHVVLYASQVQVPSESHFQFNGSIPIHSHLSPSFFTIAKITVKIAKS